MLNTLTRSTSLRLTLLCLCLGAVSRASAQQSTIHIIPRPRQLTTTADVFKLDQSASLRLADPRSPDDQFAASDFIADVNQTAGLTLKIRQSKAHAILIGQLNLPSIKAAV